MCLAGVGVRVRADSRMKGIPEHAGLGRPAVRTYVSFTRCDLRAFMSHASACKVTDDPKTTQTHVAMTLTTTTSCFVKAHVKKNCRGAITRMA